MKKLILVALGAITFGGNAETRDIDGLIQNGCMTHAQVFNLVSKTAASLYPEKTPTEELMLPQAPKTTPPEAGVKFVQSIIDRIYTDKTFRRVLRDSQEADFTNSYYQDCLEEPQNYLSDYNSIKKG